VKLQGGFKLSTGEFEMTNTPTKEQINTRNPNPAHLKKQDIPSDLGKL
jgi:hypothetical protein